jgi:hypothetical protein
MTHTSNTATPRSCENYEMTEINNKTRGIIKISVNTDIST